MKRIASREVAGHVFDRVGRVIDGIIDNGRLILMIMLFVSVGFMVRELADAADSAAHQAVPLERATQVKANSVNPANPSDERVQARSEYRIWLHRECASDAFRQENLAIDS
jgi:hypothetical protein